MSQIVNKILQYKILTYLKSKGNLKACLLYKLEKSILNQLLENNDIQKRDIHKNIISLVKNRKIDIIIPHFFKIKWIQTELKHLKYLKDGKYLIRTFVKKKKDNGVKYFFDSRNMEHIDELKITKKIQEILNTKGELKRKIILYMSSQYNPLNIYEEFTGNYNVNFLDFRINENIIKDKISISLKEQQNYQLIIYNYRKKYMCCYITIIETIQNIIINLMEEKEMHPDYKQKMIDLRKKFAFYCDLFVTSDWIDVKPNPYKWESFFKYYKLPFKINLVFENVKFSGRTFELYIKFQYAIKIKRKAKNIIHHLKEFGYKILNIDRDSISIGYIHHAYIPCSSIEYFYFCGKYFFYYYLFLLFKNTFEYIKKEYPKYNFSTKDRDLYKVFLPITNLISNFKPESLNKNIIFKYYIRNPDELEIIYNKFLLPYIRPIEKKLYKYFLIKDVFNNDYNSY
ncbi:MAG: hypothetical protein KGD57_08290 [Candidatus Lokiarchaeota archaeon]|nr:hypothetical protein [Candidatus Lokiarchaeota archaeon]